jgi:hypothetical protein
MTADPKSKRRIKVMKDGPYIVSGKVPLAAEWIVIGGDGAHVAIGFKSKS